jgi:8-amino-7-oxononanoate synthase
MGKPFQYITESKLQAFTHINGKQYLYFAGTGYFQLQSHPELIEAAVTATRKYGIGSATSRTINGTTPLLTNLEKKIAEFFQTDDAAYLPSGYLSNVAGIQALSEMGLFDVVFIDEKAHYSNTSAALASGKKVISFHHLDPDDLQKKISKTLRISEKPLIVSDGLFPIWAKVAPVPAYLNIAQKYDGIIWMDDAHGVGILGENGRGVYEHFQLHDERLFMGATLSKAFGAYGGIVTGNQSFIDTLKSGDVMTGTNSPPAALAAAGLKGIELIQNHSAFLRQLRKNALYLKEKLRQAGLEVDKNDLPIVTFSTGNETRMKSIQQMLMEEGIYIQHVKYVGSGDDGVLRIVVSSEHTKNQIDLLVSSLLKHL